MDVIKLAEEIISGRRLNRNDDLSFLISCDNTELCKGADMLRSNFCSNRAELCSIVNGRSGRCSEDCRYCAQSAHYNTDCQVYDFLPEETILEACRLNEREGVDRFSVVTSGRALDDEEFEKALKAFEAMHRECDIGLCASMGFLNSDQLNRLREAGVTAYHHNIETSERFFPHICTTHSFEDKLETLKRVKAAGLKVCSGGIIGMGETWEDRIDMALTLSEFKVDSIPINSLIPIKGTPLEHVEHISENDILRTVAIFRYIAPEADIRLAAGRALLQDGGRKAFCSGASAAIVGNMLTTGACAAVRSDREMLKKLGRTIR